ncbi:MAG: alpha-L-arabinofuranosidase C-terminal domain-containing protein [Chthonomonadales bacterium]
MSVWTMCGIAFSFMVGLSARAQKDAVLTVDAASAKTGPAISPYLYGQFIEHLGRCIHGGIWAEMLQDRKFLLEPGKSWQVFKADGADCTVAHDPAGAYAGDHCMAIWLRKAGNGPCGIRQGDLGLVEGREYVGYAILAQVGSPAPVEIRLSWGTGERDGQTVRLDHLERTYGRYSFRFKAGATTDAGTLTLAVRNPTFLWIGCLSLMPTDNVEGMRPDVLDLVRRLAPPITRWPGGNFVSGYHWKDGVGPRDRRPPRWERAWGAVEDNDFGLDEFLRFCRLVGTEPYIAVNTGLGSVEEAADEVEYANGAPTSTWGSRRAGNGHREPYGVRWWGIGNEMFGDWQLGHVPSTQYAYRHNAFVDAMKAKDGRIHIIGVGAPGPWNDVILPLCAAHMDLLSGHHYSERRFRIPFSPQDAEQYRNNFPAYSASVAEGIRRIVQDLRSRQAAGNSTLRHLGLAVDEWGIVRDWNPAPDGPGVGPFEHYYCLGDAIAAARGLNELLRNCDLVHMANWAQTVNVIGAIKTTRTQAVLDPVGHVLALYRAHLAGRLAKVSVPPEVPLDAVSAVSKQGNILSLAVVNFGPSPLSARLHILGAEVQDALDVWHITGTDLGATNIAGQPEAVTTSAAPAESRLADTLVLPGYSVTLIHARLKR